MEVTLSKFSESHTKRQNGRRGRKEFQWGSHEDKSGEWEWEVKMTKMYYIHLENCQRVKILDRKNYRKFRFIPRKFLWKCHMYVLLSLPTPLWSSAFLTLGLVFPPHSFLTFCKWKKMIHRTKGRIFTDCKLDSQHGIHCAHRVHCTPVHLLSL